MTKFQDHKQRWIRCRDCEYGIRRNKIVLLRGRIPCDVLFVGEAPGASENVLGKPFCGPAGKVLDDIIAQAGESAHWNKDIPELSMAFTNLVACIPLEGETKAAEPSLESIEACATRLEEVLDMGGPSLVVRVGRLATKHFTPEVTCVDLIHPAAILRMDVSQQGLAYQRNVVKLRDAIEEVF